MSKKIYATPFEAENAFYDALENLDVDAMMDVWASDDTVVCVLPFSERHHGQDEVLQGWLDYFCTLEPVKVQLHQPQYTHGPRLAVHVLYQHSHTSHGNHPTPTLVVTNIYKKTGEGWEMIMHQASPLEPAAPALDMPDVEHVFH